MSNLKNQENQLLQQLYIKHNLPEVLMSKLLRSAEENHYRNTDSSERRTDYLNLITYYNKDRGN